jgi:hypothetical protein
MAMVGPGGTSWRHLEFFVQFCKTSRTVQFRLWKQVDTFNSGSGSAAVMFAIGQALQGHVNEQARTIFNNAEDFDSRIGPAKQAISFCEAQIKATKDAMHAWTLVGIKLKVVKDVRKLISKLVWDSRKEALFQVSWRQVPSRETRVLEVDSKRKHKKGCVLQ